MANHSVVNPFSAQDLARAWQLIQHAHAITLLAHRDPDGDSMSACAALEAFLLQLGKHVETIYPNKPPFESPYQPRTIHLNAHTRQPDIIISCDASNYERIYLPDSFKKAPHINIDHHISNNMNGAVNLVDGNSSSTGEVLYHILSSWDKSRVNKDVATHLLAGILYDTQAFHTKNTRPSSLRIAADLADAGADLFTIKNNILSHRDAAIIPFWGYFISTIHLTKNKKAAWGVMTQAELKKYGLTIHALTGFNNFLAEISGIDVVALFYEMEDGKTKVTLRSKSTDVNAIANTLGGGGHKNAAGAVVASSPQETVKKITPLLEQI